MPDMVSDALAFLRQQSAEREAMLQGLGRSATARTPDPRIPSDDMADARDRSAAQRIAYDQNPHRDERVRRRNAAALVDENERALQDRPDTSIASAREGSPYGEFGAPSMDPREVAARRMAELTGGDSAARLRAYLSTRTARDSGGLAAHAFDEAARSGVRAELARRSGPVYGAAEHLGRGGLNGPGTPLELPYSPGPGLPTPEAPPVPVLQGQTASAPGFAFTPSPPALPPPGGPVAMGTPAPPMPGPPVPPPAASAPPPPAPPGAPDIDSLALAEELARASQSQAAATMAPQAIYPTPGAPPSPAPGPELISPELTQALSGPAATAGVVPAAPVTADLDRAALMDYLRARFGGQ